jgi:hypothetical protein
VNGRFYSQSELFSYQLFHFVHFFFIIDYSYYLLKFVLLKVIADITQAQPNKEAICEIQNFLFGS